MSELLSEVKEREALNQTTLGDSLETGDIAADEATETATRSPSFLRSRNRWQLAYTLLNNPSTIPLRGSQVNLGPTEKEEAGAGTEADAF
jgi:hypothetical protein